MYMEGSEQYRHHEEHYGSLSRFGYKDLCAQWILLNREPDELISRYERVSARLFMAFADHHDSSIRGTQDASHRMQELSARTGTSGLGLLPLASREFGSA